jgi:hypothetical protein
MPHMWRYGHTPPPIVSVRRGTPTMDLDERKDRLHEENGPQVDRRRLCASSSISIMAPAATQSGTMDTGDICDVPLGPRKGNQGGTSGLHKRTHVENVPPKGPFFCCCSTVHFDKYQSFLTNKCTLY